MSTTKIAINGFGRIGRLAFRKIHNMKDIEVVAINDLTDAKTLAHLLKYDSAQGRFEGKVTNTETAIVVDGKEIPVYKEKDPSLLPWTKLQVEVVIECTGHFNSKDKAELHIKAGAKKVVLSAAGGNDVPTIVYNVNHQILTGKETVVSGASCTTNCLAPMAKALNDAFTIEVGSMTTVHAYTNDQNTLDGPHAKGDLRRARAAAQSIIPNSTNAAKAIGLVLPEIAGKLDGGAQRVPVITGSLTELVAVVSKKVTKDEVNAVMKAAANESFGYNEDPIVSADVIGIEYGSLFDATQTKVINAGDKQLVKVAAWYDNEMSYTCQLIRTVLYLAKLAK